VVLWAHLLCFFFSKFFFLIKNVYFFKDNLIFYFIEKKLKAIKKFFASLISLIMDFGRFKRTFEEQVIICHKKTNSHLPMVLFSYARMSSFRKKQ